MSKETSWKSTVAVCLATAFVVGFAIGFILGNEHVLTPNTKRVLMLKGVLAESYYELGKIEEANGKNEEARENYNKALKEFPYLVEIYPSLKELK